MQVIKLGLIFLNLVFILGDPLFVLCSQFKFVFLQFFNLPHPLIVTFALKKLNLSLQLLNSVFFLLQLHIVESFVRVEATFIASDGSDHVF